MLVVIVLTLALPTSAWAGPLAEALEKAARETALAQQPGPETRSRTRFWTGLALLAGGAALVTLGTVEIGDDETGPDDGEDLDDSDDGEDSDVNKGLIGGGVAAASLGGWLLLTGRSEPVAAPSRRGGVTLSHTVRF
jgi:hypothetical protein